MTKLFTNAELSKIRAHIDPERSGSFRRAVRTAKRLSGVLSPKQAQWLKHAREGHVWHENGAKLQVRCRFNGVVIASDDGGKTFWDRGDLVAGPAVAVLRRRARDIFNRERFWRTGHSMPVRTRNRDWYQAGLRVTSRV